MARNAAAAMRRIGDAWRLFRGEPARAADPMPAALPYSGPGQPPEHCPSWLVEKVDELHAEWKQIDTSWRRKSSALVWARLRTRAMEEGRTLDETYIDEKILMARDCFLMLAGQ